ncbi:hypothetical protein O7626_04390 [Micromonospora sp. WMMD1102]|uniref:hypothetical protein n=1 Tax=Micromonospora sp. WMMD1102 TaxID=3016105 RepID=UPI002415198B|nr:hypothetical protein [Micromonospora sp. WMMD1102]MDG4785179.1 hypothetical protein [Micromonospora sp. WMMD1102]
MTGSAPGGRRTGREADGRPERAHLPQRPVWLCRACGVEWPCLAARSLLPLDHVRDPAGLTTWLAEAFAAAMGDLYLLNPEPGPDPARMYARFLGWVAPRMEIIRRREQASGSADPAGPANPSGSVGQPGEG